MGGIYQENERAVWITIPVALKACRELINWGVLLGIEHHISVLRHHWAALLLHCSACHACLLSLHWSALQYKCSAYHASMLKESLHCTALHKCKCLSDTWFILMLDVETIVRYFYFDTFPLRKCNWLHDDWFPAGWFPAGPLMHDCS